MQILIIGGTQFVGRALVEAALAKGHTLTLFHRGKTNAAIFPEVERIIGDRDGDLAALGQRQWDAVIDTCGYVPRVVRAAADYLADKVKHYVFISTISVYADATSANRDEDAALTSFDGTEIDPTIEEVNGQTYGPLKVLCEQTLQDRLPDQTLIIRPGLIVGPHDPTNRFTYWVNRIQRGGTVLAPANPDAPTQFIDTRDLADFTLRLVEAQVLGVFNATGPDYRLTMGAFLDACLHVIGSDARLQWADENFLVEQKVTPFTEMPLWLPSEMVEAFNTISIQRGIAAGLRFRPLATTIQDTLEWVKTLETLPGRAGMTAEREAELLQALGVS